MTGIRTDSGRRVQERWKIPALQTRFHREGDFYMPLDRFPGALADPNGHVLFPTEEQYLNCRYINFRGSSKNPRIGVPVGISSMPEYVRVKREHSK
jgi:hypothetical protein